MNHCSKPFPKFLCLLLAAAFLFPGAAWAEDVETEGKAQSQSRGKPKWREYFGRDRSSSEGSNPEGMLDVVDSPTTNVVDYGAFRLNFRLYTRGSIQNHLSFGVFRRLNLGANWDVERFIGNEDATANAPTLNVKFRLYDGGPQLPSLAMGYDGQGRFFDKAADEYRERERGLYGVLGRELFLPGLEFFGGANITKFKQGEVYGSLASTYTFEEKVAILLEYDNIRKAPDNRFNGGLRIFPTPSLAIDFAVRHITEKDFRERIIRINYVGSF